LTLKGLVSGCILPMNSKPHLYGKEKNLPYTLPAKEVRPEYVKRNFTEISSTYDIYNDLITFGLHRFWKKKTIKSLGLSNKHNSEVLDLCCGSGDLSLMLAENLGNQSTVIALDFSPGMLEVMKRRVDSRKNKSNQIIMREGDAGDLSFQESNSADGVTIAFGLRNVSDRNLTLKEIHRVLKPGAKLAILDVGKVTLPVISSVHRFFFKTIVPVIGHLLSGKKHEMYDYLPASADEYPGQQQLKKELCDIGFKNVIYKDFLFGSAVLHNAVK
jgi:demethylmenaquinone methyltransferase / 2-methoxy-6-polyprenyl-1,4-benzoquinol methylase